MNNKQRWDRGDPEDVLKNIIFFTFEDSFRNLTPTCTLKRMPVYIFQLRKCMMHVYFIVKSEILFDYSNVPEGIKTKIAV